MYMTSKVGGDSNRPVGDYCYVNMSNNTIYIARLGARWADGAKSGLFYWNLDAVASSRYCTFGGRLCRKIKDSHYCSSIKLKKNFEERRSLSSLQTLELRL